MRTLRQYVKGHTTDRISANCTGGVSTVGRAGWQSAALDVGINFSCNDGGALGLVTLAHPPHPLAARDPAVPGYGTTCLPFFLPLRLVFFGVIASQLNTTK